MNDDIEALLSVKIGKKEVEAVALWASANIDNREKLLSIAFGPEEKSSSNALWCMTHLRRNCIAWLISKRDFLIDSLLNEKKTSRKRMILQLLREQDYSIEDIRTDFLDYCLTHINDDTEEYAIRCFSLYIAFKMCLHYTELLSELKERISLLSREPLSPGLRCAVRKITSSIRKIESQTL